MAEYKSAYLKDKSLEELIEDLGKVAQPGSSTHEMIRAAVQAEMMKRLAAPRKWTWVTAAAVVSALAAVASVIAGAS